MTVKPKHITGYDARHTQVVRATCLDLATRLGDLTGEIVVVGGMVPGLIIPQDKLPAGAEPHCGTMDIDLGLAVALFDDKRYQNLTERLRSSGFEPDRNESGNITLQRWRVVDDHSLTIDFLVSPSSPEEEEREGKIRHIESDFAAVIVPGLHLAFLDRLSLTLSGTTRKGEQADAAVSVCGPAAFIALKALAFARRGENKGAYRQFQDVLVATVERRAPWPSPPTVYSRRICTVSRADTGIEGRWARGTAPIPFLIYNGRNNEAFDLIKEMVDDISTARS